MGETAASARAERLRAIPLLAELSDESLSHVLDIATEFGVERGHVLVDRGQPGTGLFVLEEGRVSVELPGRAIELGPGEFFGELALLDERAVRTARVSAATSVRCLAIRRDDFQRLLTSEPKLALKLLKVLAHRLASAGGD
ncbi:MAG: cyclic nucleotide-binding domain-containing protein [Actinomycetota bacterium]